MRPPPHPPIRLVRLLCHPSLPYLMSLLFCLFLFLLSSSEDGEDSMMIWGGGGARAASTRRVLLLDNSGKGLKNKGSDWWVYILVPLINAVVGYATNVLALFMTFEPIEMWPVKLWAPPGSPVGLIGWQGIIPAKAGQMAAIMTDLMTERLIDVKEVFARVDAGTMSKIMAPNAIGTMRKVVESVMQAEVPGTWMALPDAIKLELAAELAKDAGEFVKGFMARLQENIMDVFDLKAMCVRLAEADKRAINEMFQACGEKEFVFIRRSGLYFGFIFGLLQLIVFIFYDPWWLAMLGGFVVGFATNWVALKLIFEPIDPVNLGCFNLHGLFLKRQEEVSLAYAQHAAETFVTPENVWQEILHGSRKEEFRKMLTSYTKEYVERSLSKQMGPFVILMPAEKLSALKEKICEVMVEDFEYTLPLGYDYTKEALDIERTLHSALVRLPSRDFERVLHPGERRRRWWRRGRGRRGNNNNTIKNLLLVFEEDELKLILVGGALGSLAGLFQGLVLF